MSEILQTQMKPDTEMTGINIQRTATLYKKCNIYICELKIPNKYIVLMIEGLKNFLAVIFAIEREMIQSFIKGF